MKTKQILNEREKTHGDFERFANLKMALVEACDGYGDYSKLTNTQAVALNMVLTKVARIMCGDPNFDDHWDDIAGYAMLGKEEKNDECGCYTMPGTEEFIKCRKCQNGRCAICHVAVENGFLYTPCASIPPRVECNLYFCWDCVEKHENSTGFEEVAEPSITAWFGCCKCDKYKRKKDIAKFNEPGSNEYTVTCKDCLQEEESISSKEECTHQDFRFFAYDEDFDDNMHQWWCLHCKKFFRWRNPGCTSFRRSVLRGTKGGNE